MQFKLMANALSLSLVLMTDSTAGQPYLNLCWALDFCALYNTQIYIFRFVCSADHISLKHIALSIPFHIILHVHVILTHLGPVSRKTR